MAWIKVIREGEATGRLKQLYEKYMEPNGIVDNILKIHSLNVKSLQTHYDLYAHLMRGRSDLSRVQREMIAVVVSSANHCYYCLVAHGAAVREMSGDPELGEMLVMNYRVADLPPRQKAMLDFAVLLTNAPATIEEEDRQALRDHGFSDRDIWDIAAVAGFFNMSNRVASATDMRPNDAYHAQAR